MSVTDKIIGYLRDNVSKNVKEIVATLGSMILTLLATIIFILRSGFGASDAFIIVLLELQPFCYIYIKIIFSGESNIKDQEILVLKNRLGNMQELSEYKIKLAARDALILANKDWTDINEFIKVIDGKY